MNLLFYNTHIFHAYLCISTHIEAIEAQIRLQENIEGNRIRCVIEFLCRACCFWNKFHIMTTRYIVDEKIEICLNKKKILIFFWTKSMECSGSDLQYMIKRRRNVRSDRLTAEQIQLKWTKSRKNILFHCQQLFTIFGNARITETKLIKRNRELYILYLLIFRTNAIFSTTKKYISYYFFFHYYCMSKIREKMN